MHLFHKYAKWMHAYNSTNLDMNYYNNSLNSDLIISVSFVISFCRILFHAKEIFVTVICSLLRENNLRIYWLHNLVTITYIQEWPGSKWDFVPYSGNRRDGCPHSTKWSVNVVLSLPCIQDTWALIRKRPNYKGDNEASTHM